MRRRALVTGITGQDGSLLAEQLLVGGYEVFGLVRPSAALSTWLDTVKSEHLHLIHGDMLDKGSLRRALLISKPDEIYNLAAQSHIQISFEMPAYTGDVNGLGVLRLLEAIRDYGKPTRLYQASTSEMFGTGNGKPQNENTPFNPQSPYAASKVFAHNTVKMFREAYGLFAATGICFNHESARRGMRFVTRKITEAAVAISRGKQATLYLGNLHAKRDWGYAPDYVKAMRLILTADEPDDYVVATGETYSVRYFCTCAFKEVGMRLEWRGEGLNEVGYHGSTPIVRVDESLLRPNDVEFLCGDSTKISHKLGWKPSMSFNDLVRNMVAAAKQAE